MTTKVVLPGVTKAVGLLGRRLVAYGHSYLAADPQNAVGWRYIVQQKTRLQASRLDNYSSGGDTANMAYNLARLTWNHDTEAIVVVDCTQNDFRVNGTGTAGQDIFRKDLTRLLDHLRRAYTVLVMEQVYMNQVDYDYMFTTYGIAVNDAVIDTYNAIAAEVVADHPNAYVVPLNDRGWDRSTMNYIRHNTNQGMIFSAWQVDSKLAEVEAPTPLSNPLTDPLTLPWKAVYWASDPGWTPPANGATVDSWRDASGNGHNAVQATEANKPTYTASHASFNNRPTLSFSGTKWLRTAAFDGLVYQPDTIVIIYKSDSGATMNIVDGIDGVNYRQLLRKVGITNRRITSKSPSLNDAVPDNNTPAMVTMQFDNLSSFIEVNGVETARGATGSQSLTGFTIGAAADNTATQLLVGQVAFLGVLPGAITEAELNLLEAWAASYYGLPVTPDPPVVIDPVTPPDLPGEIAPLAWHTALFAGGDWAHPVDGATLDAWPDSSGNAHNAIQATSLNRPTFDVDGLNGRQCIRFAGDDWLAVEFAELTQPTTLVVVGFTDTGSSQSFIDGFDQTHRHFVRQVGITNYRLYAGEILDAPVIPDRVPHLFVAVFNGASSSLEIDGALVASGNSGAQTLTGLTIGAAFFGGSDWLTGGIGFAGLLPGVISSGDRTILEQWAASEYGIESA